MRVLTPGGASIEIGTTEATPTVSIIDFSRRVTDDFGITRVVERGFARRMSVRLALPFDQVDTVQRQLAALRATPAQWIADERFSSLAPSGFYKDFSLDLAAPPVSFCTLTVEGLAERDVIADAGGDPAPEGQASTLQLLQPIAITGGVLAASTVPENDHPEWSPSESYGLGARVIKAATHRLYESAAAANLGADPAVANGKWIDVGPTNRWAAFDQALGTATSAPGSITMTLDPATLVDAVALLDVFGATVRVQAPGYDRTLPAGPGAVTFLDLLATDAAVTVTIAGPGQVSVGTLLLGRLVRLGITEASPTAGITDFSRKEVDDFGAVAIVQRAWAQRMTARALIRTDAIDVVTDRVAAVRARPSLWIGQAGLDSLTVYGFFKDCSIEVGSSVSKLSLSIEGLSRAAPVMATGSDAEAIALLEAQVADILSDGLITRGRQKRELVQQWAAIEAEWLALDGRFATLGSPGDIATSRTDAQGAYQQLASLLASLDPAWDDVASDTPVDGALLAQRFTAARQKLEIFAAAITGRQGAAGLDAEVYTLSARSNTTVEPAGYRHGLRLPDGNPIADSAAYARSYTVGARTGRNAWLFRHFDVYGAGEVQYQPIGPGGNDAGAMAAYLNSLADGTPVVIYTSDEPAQNRGAGGLPAAIYRCGGSPDVFLNGDRGVFNQHSAYILVGVAGWGVGRGFELFRDRDRGAVIQTSFSIVNGVPQMGTVGRDGASAFTLLGGSDLRIMPTAVTKTSGPDWSPASVFYTLEKRAGGCELSFVAGPTSGPYFSFGIERDGEPSPDGVHTSFEWHVVPNQNAADIQIFEGTAIRGTYGQVAGQVHTIRYDDHDVVYLLNGIEQRRVEVGPGIVFRARGNVASIGTGPSRVAWSTPGSRGADGQSPYLMILTNEAHTLAAASTGEVLSYLGADTRVQVLLGSQDVTSAFVPHQGGVEGGNPQELVVSSVGFPMYSLVGGFDAGENQATVALQVDGTGPHAGVSLRKVWSFSKSKTGATGGKGADAKLIYITSSSQTVSLNKDGGVIDATIKITAVTQNAAGGTPVFRMLDIDGTPRTAWDYAVNLGPGLGGTSIDYNNFSISASVLYGHMAYTGTAGQIFEVAFDNDYSVTDRISIVRVRDGATGNNGANGANAATVTVSASPIAVSYNKDGVITSGPVTFTAVRQNAIGPISWASVIGHGIYNTPGVTFDGDTMTMSAERVRDVLAHNNTYHGVWSETIIAAVGTAQGRSTITRVNDGKDGQNGAPGAVGPPGGTTGGVSVQGTCTDTLTLYCGGGGVAASASRSVRLFRGGAGDHYPQIIAIRTSNNATYVVTQGYYSAEFNTSASMEFNGSWAPPAPDTYRFYIDDPLVGTSPSNDKFVVTS